MIRKMDLSPGEFHEMCAKWRIPGSDKKKLREHYSNLRKQIFQPLDTAIEHQQELATLGIEEEIQPESASDETIDGADSTTTTTTTTTTITTTVDPDVSYYHAKPPPHNTPRPPWAGPSRNCSSPAGEVSEALDRPQDGAGASAQKGKVEEDMGRFLEAVTLYQAVYLHGYEILILGY